MTFRARILASSAFVFLVVAPAVAWAGPPFVTDDPVPVERGHFETFWFTAGSAGRDGYGGVSGIDFNYGLARDLHINIVVPVEYDRPRGGPAASGVGNIEIAAKYRFIHQDGGWDVAVYPRLVVPSLSRDVGDDRTALFLPLWVERDFGGWSSYGGGGCTLTHGGGAVNSCIAGWVLSREVAPGISAGAEIVHQTPDAKGGRATTGLGAGVTWDITDHYHLLASAGPNLQNVPATARYNWYLALQTTF